MKHENVDYEMFDEEDDELSLGIYLDCEIPKEAWSQHIADEKGVPRTRAEMKWAEENSYVIPAFRDGKVTVDKLLDHVDVVLEWYTPSVDAFDFMNFFRLVLGEEPENSNPPAHYFLIDCVFKSPNVKTFFSVRNIDYDMLNNRVLVLATREFSKALTLDTKLATPTGYVKMRDIKKDDYVIARDGHPTKVTSKSGLFFNNTYRITLADDRTFETSYNHDNIVWKRKQKHIMYVDENENRTSKKNGKPRRIGGFEEKVMTTEDLFIDGFKYERMINDNQKKGFEYKYFIPMMDNPVEFNACNFPIDPYTVGVILGDGSVSKVSGHPRFTCHKDDLEHYVKNIPYDFGVVSPKQNSNAVATSFLNINKLVKEHIGTDRSYTKKIPEALMTGSVEERIAVLQGLMDTDGSINKKGSPAFSTVSKELAENVQQLIFSLGGSARIKMYKTDSPFGKSYLVSIRINNVQLFRLPRKQERETYVHARDFIGIKDIELIHSKPTQCITVESESKSFILENGVVTHNSVLLGSVMIMYIAAKGKLPGFGKINYMLYISDSMRNNVKTTMETIGQVYYESAYLQSIFEDARLVQDEISFVRKPSTQKEIAIYNQYVNIEKKDPKMVPGRMKRKFTMSGVGASTGARGSREGLDRPQGVFFDDLLGNEVDAGSDTILDNIESTIESDILRGLSGAGYFCMFAGTPYNKNDPAYRRIEDGSWLPVVFPKAEKMDKSVTKENFRGVWPDRHSYAKCKAEWVKAKRADMNGNPMALRKLNQENYLRIADESDRMIRDNMIVWYNSSSILENAYQFNWYMTTDYTTEGGKKNDFSGAFLWAVTANSEHLLVDFTLRTMDLETQYNNTFEMIEKYIDRTRGIEVGIELDGGQRTHIFSLKKKMPERNTWFTIARQKGDKIGAEGIRSRLEGGNKHWRAKLMLPYFQNKKIWFPEEMKGTEDMSELLEEIKYTTYTTFGAADDGIDCISQLNAIEIIYPAKEAGSYEAAQLKKEARRDPKKGWSPWGRSGEEDEERSEYDSY